MDAGAGEVRGLRLAAAAGAVALVAAQVASACGEALRGTTGRAESVRYEIVFVPVPAPIAASQLFALDIAVCPRGGAAPPTALSVDAVMRDHRHGMNYRPVVTARGAGSFRAEGMMFHMPGRWDLLFDLATGSGAERLTATIRLE